jgi:hypothetical protein
MLRYFFIGLLSLANLSCHLQQAQTANNSAENDLPSISNSLVNSANSANDETEERFVETLSDDSNVGVSRNNRVELSIFGGAKYNRVELKFYSLDKAKKWQLKQTIEVKKYGSLSCDMQIKDFNNDGYKDVTFVSGIAARGANEVRSLFIYDKKADQLIYIKNSEEYPNLLYNKTLNCIDSQIFTGGNETVFLKLEGDMLKEFASVETTSTNYERKVYLIDKTGKEQLLRTDKVSEEDILERYKTFNPPTVNTDLEPE